VVYLLGFFLCVIAVFAAAVGTLIGFSNVSTSERVGTQYPPAVVEAMLQRPTENRASLWSYLIQKTHRLRRT
jgi:ABC-type bacteriocin/lantibiotic exporter with double-glycine peptidase domain